MISVLLWTASGIKLWGEYNRLRSPMYRCPHCRESLGATALLNMNPNTLSVCKHCGQRYGWDVSGSMMLLMIFMVIASVIALLMTISIMPVVMAGLAIPILIGVCGYLALCAFRPVAR
jgi:uncharacterized protein (DUF983 family)